jgi:mRNA interferase RelE/StbE
MEVQIDQSFIRDVKKAPVHMQKLIPGILKSLRDAKGITDLDKVKKMAGAKNAYRIRIDDYRLGFYIENQTIILSRFLARKDIYRFFPK